MSAVLRAEYLAAMRDMTLDNPHELMRHDISLRTITLVCPAPTRVVLDGDLYYQPDPKGDLAWVLCVSAVDPHDPESIETVDPGAVISIGAPVDLLAFHPAAPRRWALRCGLATVLGAIEPQYGDPEPVPVHRDITGWLRSECRGIVLLTRDPHEVRRILQQISTIEAEDGRHADELDELLVTPPPKRSRIITRTLPRAAP